LGYVGISVGDNIKMDCEEVGCEDVDRIHVIGHGPWKAFVETV
jgi:hypothetical protein